MPTLFNTFKRWTMDNSSADMDGTPAEGVKAIIDNLAGMCYDTAKAKGFWDKPRNKGEMVALIHSEVSELLEAIRKPAPSDHIPEFSGEEEECADIIIRVFDYFAGNFPGRSLTDVLRAKMEFNFSRPHKHGKAF